MSKSQIRYPAMSEARLRMLNEPGHLYAVYSRYCDWIKLGFSSKVDERLESINLQYAEFAPFSLIGKVRSMYRAEQQLHSGFAAFRLGRTGRTKELYPAVKPLVQVIKNILTHREWVPMSYEQCRSTRRWAQAHAQLPLNRIESVISFERYAAERRRPLENREGV